MMLFSRHGNAALRSLRHAFGPFEQPNDVDAQERRRDHAEIGERRVPSADVRVAVEDRPEPLLFCQRLERRPRVGNGYKIFSGAAAFEPFDALMKVSEEVKCFRGSARFAGHQEQRLGRIQRLFDVFDGRRHSRVEYVEVEVARRGAKCGAANVGTKAASSHAQQQRLLEAALPNLFCKIHNALNVLEHGLAD